MYFKKIRDQYNDFQTIISEYSPYLLNGNYMISKEKKKIVYLKNNKEVYNFVKEVFLIDKQKYSFISKLKLYTKSVLFLFTPINKKENTDKNSFQGSILMKSWNEDIKIFDLNNKKVITFFSTRDKYLNYINTIKHFESDFKTPFIKSVIKENMILEKLICDKKLKDKKTDYFSCIVRQYQNYLSSTVSKKVINTKNLFDLIKKDHYFYYNLFNQFHSNYSYNIEIPIFIMHSDLHFDNILIENNDIYFIDWEHSSLCPFYYDVFNIIYIDIINYNNTELLNKYLNGNFDYLYNKLFSSVNIQFKKENKIYYFLHFIYYRLTEFDLKHNKNDVDLKMRYEKVARAIKKV